MTKISFLSLNAYTLFDQTKSKQIGGAEVQLFQLGSYLSQSHDVSFIVGDFGQPPVSQFGDIKVFRGFTNYPILGPLNYLFAGISLIISVLIEKPTVLIQRGAGFETFLARLSTKLISSKFIYMAAHNDEVNGTYLAKHRLAGHLFLFALRQADLIITQSNDQKNTLREKYQLSSTVLNSAYPIEATTNSKRINTLWIARMDSWKRPGLFISLARKYPTEKFVMIGSETSDFTLPNDLPPNLTHLKYVPFNEIQTVFSQAKIFVNTSESEGFPNTFIQSALSKTPILSLSINPDKVLSTYKFGFFANSDLHQFNLFYEKLLKSEKLRHEMGESGLKYVKKYHNLNKIGLKLAELINTLLN